MGNFQCSSSWGYPEVIGLKYQAYRNYSGVSFDFDRNTHRVRAESTKIRDSSVCCFSWEFEVDDSANDELDRLVAIGRLAELSCEKSVCAVPAFWSADVRFDGKGNSCSSSSEYPFPVLSFEEGLMEYMNGLASTIKADVAESSFISMDITSGGRHVEMRITEWKEISIGRRSSIGMTWTTYEISNDDSEELISIMKDYPVDHPANYIGYPGDDVGSLFFRHHKGTYRIDVEGKGPEWWDVFCEKIFEVICRSYPIIAETFRSF